MRKANFQNQSGVLSSIFRFFSFTLLLLLIHQSVHAQKKFETFTNGNWNDTGIWLVDGNSNTGLELPSKTDTVYILHQVLVPNTTTDSIAQLYITTPATSTQTVRLELEEGAQLAVQYNVYHLADDVISSDSVHLLVDGDMVIGDSLVIIENVNNSGAGAYLTISGNLSVYGEIFYNVFDKEADASKYEIVVHGTGQLDFNTMRLIGGGLGITVDIVALDSAHLRQHGPYVLFEGGDAKDFLFRFNDTAVFELEGSLIIDNVLESPFGGLNFRDNSTIVFNGTSTQSVFGLDTLTPGDSVIFNNVIINNSSFPALYVEYGEVWIRGELDFQNNLIFVEDNPSDGSPGIVVFDTSATSINYGPGAYIYGKAGAYRPTDIAIPVGSNNRFGLIRLFNPVGLAANSLFEVTYNSDSSIYDAIGRLPANAPLDLGSPNPDELLEPIASTISLPAGVERVSETEYWTIQERENAAQVAVELFAEDVVYSGIDDYPTVKVIHTSSGISTFEDADNGGSSAVSVQSSALIGVDFGNPVYITYGTSDPNTNPFKAPTVKVDGFTPQMASAGDNVSILGDAFDLSGSVSIGGVYVYPEDTDGTTLNFTMPTGAPYAPITVTQGGFQRSTANPILPLRSVGTTILDENSFGDASSAQIVGNQSSFESTSDIKVADMNKDGLVDIVYTLTNADFVVISWQQMDGSFLDSTYGFGTAFQPTKLWLADFNNDEWMDMVIGTDLNTQIAIYYNDQAGGLVDGSGFAGFPESVFLPSGVESLEVHQLLDSDYPTIAALATNTNTYLVTYDESYSGYAIQDTIIGGEGSAGIAFADFNNDGISEIVIGDDGVSGGSFALYFREDISKTFENSSSVSGTSSGNVKEAFVLDYDKDGIMDLGGTRLPDPASITLFKYVDGSQSFSEDITLTVPSGKAIHTVRVDNIGGMDGPDIIAFTQDGAGLDQEIVFFPHDGVGGYDTPITIVATGMVTTAAWIADISGEGLPDLIVRGDSAWGNRIWFNNLPLGAPNTQATDLTFDNSTIGEISLDFNAADDASNYLVVRRDPSTPGTAPTDGNDYPVNSVWSGQTVISNGPSTSILDNNGLEEGTEYAYDVFAYNNSGTNAAYNTISPLSGNVFTAVDTLARDSSVLIGLYSALDGDNWTNNAGWDSDSVKNWYGVTVLNGRVTRVELGNNNLTGSLPDTLAYFTGLEYLDLSDNNISGGISEGIGANESLNTLLLRNNQINGPLPDTIAALPNLSLLDVGGNEIHELPSDWSKSSLQDVRLDSNQLDFGNLEHLLALSLSNFEYSGQDHSEFAGDSLAYVDSAILVGNLLEPSVDDIYTWFLDGDTLPSQTTQDLYIDPLSIEDEGSYELVVSNSSLTDDNITYGPFGLYVSTYKSDSVHLDGLYDSLGGTGWTNAANWTVTEMRDWEGVVATDTGVVELDLAGNNLDGDLAKVWFLFQMSRLERLRLADNNIFGNVPYDWEMFENLRALDLSDNDIGFIDGDLPSVATLDTLYIDGNQLNFDDLAYANLIGNFDSLSYAPQQNIGDPFTDSVETAYFSYQFNVEQYSDTLGLTYTWYQDGTEIASADSLYTFDLEELSLDNNGEYTVEITSTYAPDLTLNDGPISLFVSTLYEDSVKLVTMYNDWNGATEWTDNTNWTTGTRYDLDTWYGVTTNDTSVIELNLSANNINDFTVGPEIGSLEGLQKLDLSFNAFQGDFPDEILDLEQLTDLDISDNFFTSVPRLDSIESLETVSLGYNLIQYPDLEPLMGEFTSFTAPAMQFWEPQQTFTLETGESIDLSGYPDDGSANTTYQWFFDGDTLVGETNALLSLTNVNPDQSGFYYQRARNSVVDILFMEMDTVFLEVSSLAADSQRLADLYTALDGDNWADNTGWNTSSDLNTWFGVTVVNNEVTDINLKGNGLSGILPFSIGDFAGLKTLDLSDNQISGDILGEITQLDNLTDLDLSNNEFTTVTRLDTMAALANVSLVDNFLTFPDLEPLAASSLTLDVSSMKSWGAEDTFNLFIGDDLFLTGYANDGSANTSYQWYRNGVALADQTSADLMISGVETSESGYYYMEATNSQVPSLTMTIDSLLVNVNGLVEDSLRLVEIYDALDGDNWTNNTNWKVAGTTVDTWFGVAVENGLITRLELPNNNLTGAYPQALRELGGIVFLDLADNNISGGVDPALDWRQLQHVNFANNALNYVDSLDSEALTHLNLSGNQLEFASLQRNINVDTLVYTPQQALPDEGDSLVEVGQSLEIVINPESLGGTTQWRWVKDGDTLNSITDSVLTLDSVLKQNQGTYQVFVRNSILPDLVLETGLFDLTVSTLKNDSLALAAMYDSLGGSAWTDNTNWLATDDLGSWFGVTVNNFSVTEVDLNNNGLSGTLPKLVPFMSELQSLDLSDNKIEGAIPQSWRQFQNLETLFLDNNLLTEVPNLSLVSTLSVVDLTYNRLDFNELTPLVGYAAASFVPQAPLTDPVDTLVDIGDNFSITFTVPGADAFQWYKDGVALPSQTTPTLSLTNVQFESDGVYIGEATSTSVPGLTLATDSLFFAVSSLERDSALIRALYVATNGSGWTTQPNWNTESIQDGNWDFVTIENNRV
ncbi:MAG: FG-GAP-like repeat-containing protein, partial [Bacteroidota bacterium]